MPDPVLSRLVLQRFRSLRSEHVQFDNPTFLVGQNGSGKSNFADAFALLGEAMISPLQAVLEYRGGFAAVAHRSSARGRPSNLGLAVELRNPDPDTVQARYGFELRPLGGYGFEVVREQCVVKRSDGSTDWFDRSPSPKRSSIGWTSTADSLDPVMEPGALALPLVAGDARFQAVWRCSVAIPGGNAGVPDRSGVDSRDAGSGHRSPPAHGREQRRQSSSAGPPFPSSVSLKTAPPSRTHRALL